MSSNPVPRRSSSGKRSSLRSFAWAVGLALLLRAFVAEAYVIPSGSMSPSLEVGDRLFVNKAVYGLRIPFTTTRLLAGWTPARGEVAVFLHPQSGEVLIKRIVAVGGDTVALRDNQLVVNGARVLREALAGPCERAFDDAGPEPCAVFEEALGGRRYRVLQRASVPPSSFGPLRVPDGHVFVLGDSRDNSNDSRFWGTVPCSRLVGRAMLVWWSRGRPSLRHGI